MLKQLRYIVQKKSKKLSEMKKLIQEKGRHAEENPNWNRSEHEKLSKPNKNLVERFTNGMDHVEREYQRGRLTLITQWMSMIDLKKHKRPTEHQI